MPRGRHFQLVRVVEVTQQNVEQGPELSIQSHLVFELLPRRRIQRVRLVRGVHLRPVNPSAHRTRVGPDRGCLQTDRKQDNHKEEEAQKTTAAEAARLPRQGTDRRRFLRRALQMSQHGDKRICGN